MAHTFAHSRVARRLSLVAALTLAATLVIAPLTRAADRLDVDPAGPRHLHPAAALSTATS